MTEPPLSLEDERAIADVIVRYAIAIDGQDWELLKTCFTDDFQGDYGNGKAWTNSAQIVQHMIDVHKPYGLTLHRMSNISVRATAHGAAGRTYVDAILMEKEPGGPKLQADGWYDDELVKQDGIWRISRRNFSLVRLQTSGVP